MKMASRYKYSKEEIKAIEQRRKENKNKRTEARLKALELRAPPQGPAHEYWGLSAYPPDTVHWALQKKLCKRGQAIVKKTGANQEDAWIRHSSA